ncbi:MAG: hypothetical protein WKF84_16110 [Pyrinomonadaceae bacterium]
MITTSINLRRWRRNRPFSQGLAEAFRSDQTPPFGNMLGQLFGQSNGPQRASILNTLISLAGPALLSQVLNQRGAAAVEAA